MKKNSRGFTLVELLVVIAIMGSILVLAITSLNSISKAKKKEAKKKVENQIELAAKQYFEANEYLFESLLAGNQGSFVTIPLERLIYNDYLNTLTDPTTGKKFDKCSNITVKRQKNKKYTFSYDPTDIGNCSVSSSYNYVLEDGQELTIANTRKCYSLSDNNEMNFTGGGKWCKGKISLNFSASFTKGSGTISKIELKKNNNIVSTEMSKSKTNYADEVSDLNKKTITAVFETNKGISKEQSVDYYIDNTPPVIFSNGTDYKTNKVAKIDDINWINAKSDKKEIAYTVGYKDEHSGIDKENSYYEWKKNSESEKIKVSSMKNGTEEFGDYYAHKTIYHNDDGVYVDKFYICDIAENCAPMVTKYYGIDKTPPTLTYNITSTLNDNTTANASTVSFDEAPWTNKALEFSVTAKDTTSGIDNNHDFNSIISEKYNNKSKVDKRTKIYNNSTSDRGTFYIEWLNTAKNSSGKWVMEDKMAYDLLKENVKYTGNKTYVTCEGNKCTRSDGGLGAIDANRYQTYNVCDKAGNCSSKTIYAKMDVTPPTLTYDITSKWLDNSTANASVYNGKCSMNSAFKCPYTNANWTNSNIAFNVSAQDTLSGINTNKVFTTTGEEGDHNDASKNKTGVFYVEWDNEYLDTDGKNKTYYGINGTNDQTTCYNNETECDRTAGYWAINYGNRRQSYTVCDKAENCTTKTTYARFDKIAPEIINVNIPYGTYESEYCSNYSTVATKFKVRDNTQVYNVYHYLSNEPKDMKPDKDNIPYFKEGFNSVQNGSVNIYNSLKTQKSGFKQVTDVNGNGTLYEIERHWADTDVSTANRIGCGTVENNIKTPDYGNASKYCNFISAMDVAGNKTVSRICGSGITKGNSTNVKSK